jgi:hypothetical protein
MHIRTTHIPAPVLVALAGALMYGCGPAVTEPEASVDGVRAAALHLSSTCRPPAIRSKPRFSREGASGVSNSCSSM